MWPIVLIAVGCTFLLGCDSEEPERRERAGGEPSSPPPPLPAPDSGSTPRGVNPALFRPTAPDLGPPSFPSFEQAQTELSGLFQRGYRLNPEGELEVASQTDADALQRRLNELRDAAFRDPRAAQAYDRREITKYVYLTLPSFSPADRGLLYRLDQDPLMAADAVRRLDHEEIEFVRHFRGRGNPLEDSFYQRHRQLGFAMREILSPEAFGQAAATSARSIVDGSDLLDGADGEIRAKLLLRQAPPSQLRLTARYLSGRMDGIDDALWAQPPPERMPALLRDVRAVLSRESEAGSRRLALEMSAYISFVLTLQGTRSLERDMTEECRSEFQLTDEAACSLCAGIALASESPDEFDNARLRSQLLERLGRYYAEHLARTPGERISQQSLLMEGELGQALRSGRFGSFPPSEIQAVFENVRSQLQQATHIPESHGIPFTLEEIRGISASPIEMRPSDLPPEMSQMAEGIRISVPRTNGLPPWEGTLLQYLRESVDVVVFTRHAPRLSEDIGDPEATANRLFRTVIIDIDGPFGTADGTSDKLPVEMLATIAHEAYHVDYFQNLAPYDTRLVSATALNERNGHLLEAQVLRHYFTGLLSGIRPLLQQVNQSGQPFEEAVQALSEPDQVRLSEFNRDFERIVPSYTSHRLIGLAANVPLTAGVDVDNRFTDDGLWSEILPEIDRGTLSPYPTAFTDEYLRLRGMTQDQFHEEAQDELLGREGRGRRQTRRSASR